MLPTLLDTTLLAARAGGRVLLDWYGRADLEVRAKAENDFVTRADRDSEAAVVGEIRRRFPDHAILAEEGGASAGREDFEWVIDPLDGTTNFTQGLPFFCVSVACRRGDSVLTAAVLDPLRDELFSASLGGGAFKNGERLQVSGRRELKGAFLATGYPYRAHEALDAYLAAFREVFLAARAIRRCGAAALDLAYTAAGAFDGFFEFRLSPWDIAAGALLIEEAGGSVSDLDGGRRYLASGNVVAAAPGVFEQLRAALAHHASEALLDRLVPRGEAAR
ncbi:MAG: inositol monophosphatase family protein [Thermoanaerobaculia bacterium]